MNGFTYYTPTKVVFGKDAELKAGSLVKEFGGTRVLIHYGGKSALKSGLIDRVKAALDKEGIYYAELGGVVPNPRISKVREGIALVQKEKLNFILGVGGGSVIDSCKAIAYGLAEPDRDVWELYAHTRMPSGSFPVGAVLTISAAGSEMSNSSVISNDETGEKRSCNSDLGRIKFALMNPELTMTLPAYQTAAGCADIMMHTMERYFVSGTTMDITDEIAEGLLRTVMKNAEILRDNPGDLEARASVMWASSLSHNGLTGCGISEGDFASHGLEHELSGMFDVTHGAGLAAVWPAWARYVCRGEAVLPRFVRFAEKVMGVVREEGMSDEDMALAGIARMEDFYHRIGMPVNLKELGLEVTEEQILALAASCARAAGGKKGSAKVLYEADMAEIYRMAKG